MTIKETVIKNKWWILAVVIIIAFGVWWFTNRATYPDIYTPKPLAGNPNATVKIVEFSDFQCPYCASATKVVTQILENYGDQVSIEYKQFPLTNLHQYAFKAAEASECANDQGKFWEYGELLFANQKALTKRHLKSYAEQLSLDTETFNNCLDSGAKAKYVTADYNEGIGKGVEGTPTFFINGEIHQNWSYEDFSMTIESALNQTSQ